MVMKRLLIMKVWQKVSCKIRALFAYIKKLSFQFRKSSFFGPFPPNFANAKFEQRNCHEKLRNDQGKVVDIYFAKLFEP